MARPTACTGPGSARPHGLPACPHWVSLGRPQLSRLMGPPAMPAPCQLADLLAHRLPTPDQLVRTILRPARHGPACLANLLVRAWLGTLPSRPARLPALACLADLLARYMVGRPCGPPACPHQACLADLVAPTPPTCLHQACLADLLARPPGPPTRPLLGRPYGDTRLFFFCPQQKLVGRTCGPPTDCTRLSWQTCGRPPLPAPGLLGQDLWPARLPAPGLLGRPLWPARLPCTGACWQTLWPPPCPQPGLLGRPCGPPASLPARPAGLRPCARTCPPAPGLRLADLVAPPACLHGPAWAGPCGPPACLHRAFLADLVARPPPPGLHQACLADSCGLSRRPAPPGPAADFVARPPACTGPAWQTLWPARLPAPGLLGRPCGPPACLHQAC
ncbi:uncharacterized protein LOC135226041 [Macrobrachium nipponense]|uniref:uncharacterized protein LOC135226041 n=1 Tax=Macrobrachium nipponense TaxID=159736 RepID=UPI0030C7F0EA